MSEPRDPIGKRCCFKECPRRVPPVDYDFCADCADRFWRQLQRARREHMSWNYRVVRYQANGEMLVGLMEVYYDEAGQPMNFARASVLHWESIDELRGTLALMTRALAAPELAVDGDVAQHIIDGEREADDSEDVESAAHAAEAARIAADVLAAIDAEEELDGPLPAHMREAFLASPEHSMRATVRATKAGIRARVAALFAAPAVSSPEEGQE